jgi:hypothetical protein
MGAIPTRQLSLQPVAIGAAVEAMKPLKPPMKTVTGDSFTNSENSERVACHRISSITEKIAGEVPAAFV